MTITTTIDVSCFLAIQPALSLYHAVCGSIELLRYPHANHIDIAYV